LVGLRMLPPTPARAPVTFWLSSPGRTTLTVAVGTQVGTLHTPAAEPVILACSLSRVRTSNTLAPGDTPDDETASDESDRTRDLAAGRPFPAFGAPPRIGDELLLGLDGAVPGCAVRLDFRGSVRGVGVNPKHPPLVWEAWTGDEWTGCEVGEDGTGG